MIGSIIPMLFAPVPSTALFDRYHDYYRDRGWCEPNGVVRDLHLLNGKVYPFVSMNEGSVEDYIDLQRMMFMLNQNFRSKSFSIFGDTAVAQSFRSIVGGSEVKARPNRLNGNGKLENCENSKFARIETV